MTKIQIDVVSDTICPWCFIGKRRLDRALDTLGRENFDISWRPYQLYPELPKEGVDRKEFMARSFRDPEQAKAGSNAIREAGIAENISFDFSAIKTLPNTLDSHRLVRWSSSAGCQDKVVELLFSAYFEQGLDVGNHDVLVDIADKAGMDPELVSKLLNQEDDIELIKREYQAARDMEIYGVPTFVMNEKFTISGAQDTDVIFYYVNKIREKIAAQETA